MSKTLDQWLNSSSSSSEEDDKARTPFSKPSGKAPAHRARSPSVSSAGAIPRSADSPTSGVRRKASNSDMAAVASRDREAEERRKKIEEMRNRMKNVLGEAAVEKVAAAVQSANVRDSMQSSMSGYSNDFEASPTQSLPANLPPLAGKDTTSRQLMPNMRLEEVETTVVDRGCQTICEVECQTDPDPVLTSCAVCYKEQYGHTHTSFFGCGHMGLGGGNGGGTAMISGDPSFERLLQRAELIGTAASMGARPAAMHQSHPSYHPYNSNPRQHQYQSAPYYHAASGPPPPHNHLAYPSAYPNGGGAGWKEQLGFLEGSIDMLINRYNLPPPPGMEHLRPR